MVKKNERERLSTILGRFGRSPAIFLCYTEEFIEGERESYAIVGEGREKRRWESEREGERVREGWEVRSGRERERLGRWWAWISNIFFLFF